MDDDKCILQLRGVRPFFSDKYDITRHPNYHLLLDYDPEQEFIIEEYVNSKSSMRLKLPSDKTFTEYEVDVSDTSKKETISEATDDKEIYVSYSSGSEETKT